MTSKTLFAWAAAVVVACSARADWTATGQFNYTDRLYDLNGFTTTVVRPVREADVQIYDTTTLAVLASGATDSAGNFSIAVTDAATRNVGVRVLSSNVQIASLNFSVVDDANSDAVYSYHDAAVDLIAHAPGANASFGTMTMPVAIGVIASTDWSSQVFNTYDMGVLVADWIANADGARPSVFYAILWNPTNGRGGSSYNGGTNRLSLSDDDAYDDPNILHEIGHYIEDEFGRSRNTGGSHSIGDDDQDPRLAYSEGFATFVSAAALNFGGRDRPDIYQDRGSFEASPGSGFSYTFEPGTVGGSTNEQTSTAALYDLIDTPATQDASPGTDDDPLSSLQANVWSVVEQMRVVNPVATSLEDFWDIWFSLGLGNAAGMATVFASHNVDFAPDAQEPNNTPTAATTLTVGGAYQRNSFYRSGAVSRGDEDWFKFTATAGAYYSIEVNGAADSIFGRPDPEMWLFDPTLSSVLAYTDDPNDTTLNTQASSTAQDMLETVPVILWQAPANGVYHVYLRHNSHERGLLGRYGTYHIRVRTLAVPTPTVTTVAEQRMLQGQSYQTLILGTNFSRGATVTTNDAGVVVSAVNWVAPTCLVATLTPSGGVADGAYSLSVTNPGGAAGMLASAFEVSSAAAPPIRITEVELNNDAVEIKNVGTVTATLTGWTLRTSQPSAYTYTFPTFTLAAGGTAIIRDTAGTNTATDLFGSAFPWTNAVGDISLADDASRNVDFLRWVTSPTSTHTAAQGTGGAWMAPQFQAPAVGLTVARSEATALYRTPFGLSNANATMPTGAANRSNNVDEWEDNDLPGRAPIFGPVASLPGLRISARSVGTDSDWFGFLVEPGDELAFDALFTHASGNLDIQLYAPGEESTPLLSSTGTVNNERIVLTAAQSTTTGGGVYRLRVFGASGATNTYSLNVGPLNAAPVLGLPGGAVTYTENDPATLLDVGATITDGDSADFSGGALTIDFTANGAAEDRLAIRHEGIGGGQIGVSGADVSFGGVNIGTFAGGTNGTTPLVITFSSAIATPAAAQALARNITYQNVSDGPSTAARTVRFVVADGDGGTSTAVTKTVNVVAANDAPTIAGVVAGQAVNDNATTSPFNGVTLADPDSPAQTQSVSVTLDTAAKGTFTAGSLTASGFTNGGGGVYNFSGTAAAATTAIRLLVFAPTANRVTPGSTETTTFTISINDGVAAAVMNNTTTVVSTSVNNAPSIAGTAAGQTVTDKTTVSLFTGVTLADVDNPAQTQTVSVTLDTAAKGSFTTLNGFTNAGGGSYTFSGTAANATTAIRGLVFTPTANRVTPGTTETTTFTISTNDGVASAVTNNTTTAVSTSVNDAPTIAGAVSGQAVTDKTTLSPFTGVTLADVDSPAQTQTVSVTLDTAAKGSFTTLNGFTNAGGGNYTFSGTAANATTAIRGLVFTPTANRVTPGSTETTTFTISTNDGVASAVTNNTTTAVSTSVNDAPTIAGAVAGQAVNDNATIFPFGGVTLADVDSPAQTQTVSVTLDAAAKGSFTTLSGFTNAGGGSYTFSGSAAAATSAIRGLVFTPTANRVAAGSTETTTFTISTNDGVAVAVTNNTTTVVSTAINDAPTLTAIVDPGTILEDAVEQTINLSGISAGGGETQALSVTATSDNPAVVPDPIVTYTSANATGSLRYTPVTNASGSALITVTVQDNGGTINGGVNTFARTFTVTVAAVNDTPALTFIADPVAILEDAAQQTINLTGINAGGGEAQTLSVTAISDNPTLIPNPAVNYASASATGSLTYTPAENASGTATITVTVQDNGGTANAAVDTFIRTFTVNVTAVNDAPTLSAIADPSAILEDAAQQTINLAGISAGGGEAQTLTITATSDNPSLIPDPTVTYASADAMGSLSYTPLGNASGAALITVTVQDNGGTNDGGVNTITRTFTVNVTAVNDAPTLTAIADPSAILEDAAQQTINLAGISPGGGETQTLTVTATSNNPSLIPHPTVTYASADATGSLNYTPVANASGSAVITVTVQDDGGTSDGGVNAFVRSFTVNVTEVNDAPTLAAIADPAAILEDAALQSINLTGIGAGSGETQALTVTAVSSNPMLIPHPTVSYASANATGSLSYTPTAGASGSAVITVTVQDDGGTAAPGENTTVRLFTVNVTAVNDAPTLTAITDPAAILEDAGAQMINLAGIGAGDDEPQMLTVTATSDNPTLIPDPTVTYASADATGSLNYTPVAHANGTAVITVTVQDDGGTANGGENTVTRTFTVEVTAVNDVPSFTKGSNVTALEDAGGQTLVGWATAISPGAANESAQALNFMVTADQPALFAVQPAIAANGTLTFTWAADGSGSATVSVALHDDGGTTNGGDDTSDTQTFTISTTAVNDAPSFVAGPSIDTAQDAGPQNFPAWATAISAGPGEGTQTMQFLVQVDKPELFTTLPTITPAGTLAYAPAPAGSGVAIMTVRLQDNGGTSDGGADTSAPQLVEIAVTSFLEELGSYTGLVQPTVNGPRENARTGTAQIKVTKGGKFTGKLRIPGKSVAMKGTIGHDGAARFGKTLTPTLPVLRKGLPVLDLALKIEVARGTNTFGGSLTQGANAFATLDGDRALYTAKRTLVPPMENVPAALLGNYTVIFPALTPAAQGQAAAAFPQGDGFGKLTVKASGVAKLSGTLADGAKISGSAPLAKSGRWPFYRALGKTGSIGGFATFRDVPDLSDVDASGFVWFRAQNPRARQYTAGWPGGILVDLAGSKYTAPTRRAPGPVLPGLSAADGDGNAELTLVDGGLAAPGLVLGLSIDANNRSTVLGAPGPKFSLIAKTGLLKGQFTHPGSGKKTSLGGAVLQKRQMGAGFFLGPTESGAVILVPDAQPGTP